MTIGAEARTSSKTSVANATLVRPIATVDGRLNHFDHMLSLKTSGLYVAASGGITNTTTAVAIVAGQAAGIRNYLTSCNYLRIH